MTHVVEHACPESVAPTVLLAAGETCPQCGRRANVGVRET